MEIRIATCRDEDVTVLAERFSSLGATPFHVPRYARHVAGTSTYLVAWLDGEPSGVGEVRWHGCAAPEVRAAVGTCPEINGLHVLDAVQSRGIGTALIRHAEQLVAARGLTMIGLGVDERDNPRAAALYDRLGYRPVVRYLDRWSYTDDAGVDHLVVDPCVFLTKTLEPVRVAE
jgi:GNAT superfamily N-acetyltransferase